jgi:hypothetical protein
MKCVFSEMTEYRSMARVLYFAGVTHADQGNYTESSQCFLDAVEMGILISHRSNMIGTLLGMTCEQMGRKGLWEIADKLDAKTGKSVLLRLQRIEARRIDLSGVYEQEKFLGQRTLQEILKGNPKEMVETYNASLPPDQPHSTETGWPKMLTETLLAGKSKVFEEQTQMWDVRIQESKNLIRLYLPILNHVTCSIN